MIWKRALALLLLVLLVLIGGVIALNLRGERESLEDDGSKEPVADGAHDKSVGAKTSASDLTTRAPAGAVARGEYLTRAGDCAGCHTARGSIAYAGGRAIETPFGPVYAPNLTPDPQTGIGNWSAADFWRALHNGRSRDGRLLYPAFPYTNYTRVTRADSDAMYVYLRSLAPAVQANLPHGIGFPFNLQASLAIWRALYFKPGIYTSDPGQSPEWNRGAYLVEGLGHCNACHSSRNALGASAGPLDLAGGLIPVQNWYAPSLTSSDEASVAGWESREVMALLKTGISTRGTVMGPMTDVVLNGTQYLTDADLAAMSTFLAALPVTRSAPTPDATARAPGAHEARGERLYGKQCEQCHGEQGQGVPHAYPALAGSRAVMMATPANLVHIVLQGGFPPATAGNPRPFGMPPFAQTLSNDDVADLLSYIRGAWGNRADAVTALEVNRFRGAARP